MPNTTQETVEGNTLIAEFMGYRLSGHQFRNIPDNYVHPNNIEEVLSVNDFQYHSSWDWLMPVVEKIETSADQETGHVEVHIIENSCRMYRMSYTKELIKVYDPNSKITAVWQAVVQFIKWYNSQKQ